MKTRSDKTKSDNFYFFLVLVISVALFFFNSFAEEIRIGVVDTGINESEIKVPICAYHDFTGTGIKDTNGHGTMVISILESHLKNLKHCYIIAKWSNGGVSPTSQAVQGIQFVLSKNVKYLNLSYDGSTYDANEYKLLRSAVNSGVEVGVAAGNEHLDLGSRCFIFPACYGLKLFVIGSDKYSNSNYNGPVNGYGDFTFCYNNKCGSGTSFSTPDFLGKRIYEKK